MMLPEMEATRSSLRNGRLHCAHCIGLPEILQNVIFAQKKDDAKSYNDKDPATVDDWLLVRLKEFNKGKLSIADLDLHGDKKSYSKRDECKDHHAEQCKGRYFYASDAFGTDRFCAYRSFRLEDVAYDGGSA